MIRGLSYGANVRRLVLLIVSALVCGFAVSCSEDSGGSACTARNATYFNSFESTGDTAGWLGYVRIPNVLPDPERGQRCLRVTGACVQPAGRFMLPPVTKEGNYGFSCWAKVSSLDEGTHPGGELELVMANRREGPRRIGFKVSSEDWAFYWSSERLHCLEGDSLRLEVCIGDLISPGHMFLDCLKVYRARP